MNSTDVPPSTFRLEFGRAVELSIPAPSDRLSILTVLSAKYHHHTTPPPRSLIHTDAFIARSCR